MKSKGTRTWNFGPLIQETEYKAVGAPMRLGKRLSIRKEGPKSGCVRSIYQFGEASKEAIPKQFLQMSMSSFPNKPGSWEMSLIYKE